MNDKQKLSFIGKLKWAIIAPLFSFMLVASNAYAQDRQVKIGVLALRGPEESLQRWTLTAEYLTDQISGDTFIIVPLDFEQIFECVKNGEVDFVLTNSAIYVALEYLYEIDRIATMNVLFRGKTTKQFGGVIFTLKSRKDINNPEDLKNKSFMAAEKFSFGGWLMAMREFKDSGIDSHNDFLNLQFAGTHDKVVCAVRKGEVDAGTVRTGILEKMDKEGKISINDFKIINQQHPENFSLLISTRLYPEWPIAKVKHTSAQLARQVSIALLSMPSDSRAAEKADIAGWDIPNNYQSVHTCLKEICVSPYEGLGIITLANLIEQYWYWLLLGFMVITILAVVAVYVSRLNHKLNITTTELKESRNILEQKVEERTSELRESNQELIKENEDRRRAEKELQLERDNFKNILGSMADGIYIVNKEYEIKYINPVTKKEFGPADGRKCYEYLHGRTEVCPWCKISDVLAGKTVRWEWHSSKNQKTYDLIDTPFRNSDGSISKLEIFRDITEQKKAEEELKKSEYKYRRIFEESKEIIFVSSVDGRFQDINPAGIQLFGYSSLDDIQKISIPLDLYKNPGDKNEYLEQMKKSGFVKDYELCLKKKDGTEAIIVETSTAIYDDNKNVVAYRGIMRDITEKKGLEKQLMQAQKMEAIGTLAGGVAHDFNNLLTVINGYSGLALIQLDENNPLYEKILSIQQAGKRAETLTRQLLAFSRKQIYEPEIVSINQVIRSMDKMLARLISEDIHIETILPDKLPDIKADKSQLEQILINLVVNARDALNAVKKLDFHKTITIEAGHALLDKDYVSRHPGSQEGRYIFFAVSDNGIGMNEETRNRIFEPFFTTKGKYKGTGLGLSMTYGIVKQNKGSVYLYSEPGEGTMLKIYWPVTDEKLKDEKAIVEKRKIYGSETILFVEDDENVRAFATDALASLGYKVHSAANGRLALEAIEKEDLEFDIIVTDLVMPELSGKEFVEKVKGVVPDMKVLYTSGYTDNHLVHDGLLDEDTNFIHKPYSGTSLASKVRTILDNE